MKVTDPSGFCYYWCMYFLSQRLKYPDKTWKDLVKENLAVLLKNTGKKLDFRRHIRNWSQNLEKETAKKYKKILEYDENNEIILNKLLMTNMLSNYKKFNYFKK